jgi:hypothetical protein
MALKRHFTTEKYDFFKYNGVVKSSFETFKTKKDSYFFVKISNKQNWQDIILSNVIENPNIWIGEIADENGMKTYEEWRKRNESLSYIFDLELSSLDDDLLKNFSAKNQNIPLIIQQFMSSKISLETVSIVCKMTNAYSYWEKNLVDTFLYSDTILKSRKYYPFLKFDENKIRQILRKRFFEI